MDLVEMVLHLGQRQVLVEREARDDAEADDGGAKAVSFGLRESFMTSTEAVTIASAAGAVARFPFFSLEP